MNSEQIRDACMPEAIQQTAVRGLKLCDEVAHKDVEHICFFVEAEGEVAFIYDIHNDILLKAPTSELFDPNILLRLALEFQMKLELDTLR
jgi:hypothetical protein